MPLIVFAGLGGIVLGYRFLGCPVSFCSGFNISLLIEQPSLLLYNNGNFDPGSNGSNDEALGGLLHCACCVPE